MGATPPPLLLTAATALELAACLAPFGQQPQGGPPRPGDFEPHPVSRHMLAGREVLALITGVGPVNAAFSLGLALAAHPVAGVLNLGLAGSADPARLPLGAVAMATSECWPEYGLARHGETVAAPLPFPQRQLASGPVQAALALDPDGAARAMGLTLPADWPRAACATVAGVSGDPVRARQLAAATGALLENMEGFALALCARGFGPGLPFLQVRAVSNRMGLRPPEGWDIPGALAALGRATVALLGPLPPA